MQTWKKAVLMASVGAGAALLITGRRNVGLASLAGGLAVLASEYPEHFETIWDAAPEYIQRANQIFTTLSKVSEHFIQQAERRTIETLGRYSES